jgi:general secretion pathway protein H
VSRGAQGFTLLELMLVLAIAAAVMALAPPLLYQAMPGLQLKSAARQVAAGFRSARDQAITRRAETLLSVDLDERRIEWSGARRPLELPDGLEVSLVTATSELGRDARQGSIRFYPDGSSTGGRVTVSHGERGYRVDVDWLTGRVSIGEADARDL